MQEMRYRCNERRYTKPQIFTCTPTSLSRAGNYGIRPQRRNFISESRSQTEACRKPLACGMVRAIYSPLNDPQRALGAGTGLREAGGRKNYAE